MASIKWLQLSDLHFSTKVDSKWENDVVLQKLVEDIQQFTRENAFDLDMVFVSGDIAFSGNPQEYEKAKTFFDAILEVTDVPKRNLFIVPGNHDVFRDFIDVEMQEKIVGIESRRDVNEILKSRNVFEGIFKRQKHFFDFVNKYFEDVEMFRESGVAFVTHFDLKGYSVSVLGLNSAWISKGGKSDRGKLILGDQDIRPATYDCRDSSLCISIMHHPFHWLQEFDWESCESILMDRCDFILQGHLHRSQLSIQKTPDARAMIIAGGACYESRDYPNGYNFVDYDLESKKGTIYLRTWSNRGSGFWTNDNLSYKNVPNGLFPFSLNQDIYTDIPPGGDSVTYLKDTFIRKTESSIQRIVNIIEGLPEPIERDEIARINHVLMEGNSVVVTGNAGTGKSGIASFMATEALKDDKIVVFLDARDYGRVRNESELKDALGINGPFVPSIKYLSRFYKVRIIIDQLDNIVGTDAAGCLANQAIDLTNLKEVEVVVISRNRETHESIILRDMLERGFVELTVEELTATDSETVLGQIGIEHPPTELIDICKNLLNLSIVANIKASNPDYDFSAFNDEVHLWNSYLDELFKREASFKGAKSAEQVIGEAVKLATMGLNDPDRKFQLEYPRNDEQGRLVSWGIVISEDRRGQFYHEKLQDFLYAWDAVNRRIMPQGVIREIPEHRTRNILPWMKKLYMLKDPGLVTRFIEETLGG